MVVESVAVGVARFSERLVPEVTAQLWDLRSQGVLPEEIARRIGWKGTAVRAVLEEQCGVRPASARPGAGARLSYAEREEIMVLAARAVSAREIGRLLGRSHTTISRELKRGRNGQWAYRASNGHRAAFNNTRRPKGAKLLTAGPLRERVKADLGSRLSPEQIAGRLAREFADDASMTVSHETIYQAIYRDRPGKLSRKGHPVTRTRRRLRKPRRTLNRRVGRIQNMTPLSERPAEAEFRLVPGHLEGDLITGKAGKSAIGTLVDRATGKCWMFRVTSNARRAIVVRDALIRILGSLPPGQVKSLTWDQGVELHRHREITEATGVPVFFCEPRSPWQRGSNENLNGLLREYFPKSTPLAAYSQTHLNRVAEELNHRPRKRFGYATPHERLDELTGVQTA